MESYYVEGIVVGMKRHEALEEIERVLGIRAVEVLTHVGEEYFRSLVKYIAETLHAPIVLVGEVDETSSKINVLAMYRNGNLSDGDVQPILALESSLKEASFYEKFIHQLFSRLKGDIEGAGYLEMPLKSYKGEIIGLIFIINIETTETKEKAETIFRLFRDRTAKEIARNKKEKRLLKLAHYDSLTNLLERATFRKMVDEEIGKHPEIKRGFFFIDIDNFKMINDSFGHKKGDELLVKFAKRLKDIMKNENALLCRNSGDEFVIMLRDVEKDQVYNLAANLVNELQYPLILGENAVFITVSIGVSFFPEHGHNADTLIHHADLAMYEAKKDGKSTYRFYQSFMEHHYERFLLKQELRRGIANNEFVLYYQPKVDIIQRRTIGFEALVRWNHPEKGFLSPSEFIELAEEDNTIELIGNLGLDEACKQLKCWQEEFSNKQLTIAVNMSARKFFHSDLVHQVQESISKYKLPYSSLVIEITETTAIKDFEHAVKIIQKLQSLGVHIHLDDFGKGFSSLYYLNRLPVNAIKIDRSFIQQIGQGQKENPIVNAIIAMAHSLNLDVIAEGVETNVQLEYLLGKGCHIMQGYYFSKPLPADKAGDYLRRM